MNTISPGYVETDMVRAIRPEVLKSIVDHHSHRPPGEARRDRR